MPKSGSTFLSNAIAALPYFNMIKLVPDWGRREQELDEECIKAALDINFAAQAHVRYSNATRNLMEKYSIRPLVLVRNIFDVVPSFIDHHRREGLHHPMAFVPDGIEDWSFEDSARFVTAMIIPWYFNFYMTWTETSAKILIRYEELILDPNKVLKIIRDTLGLPASDREIKTAIDSVIDSSPRKNVITPGRGKTLPAECIARIREMASFYHGMDFSDIGINKSPDIGAASSLISRIFRAKGRRQGGQFRSVAN
jgi:hypothetical protein